MNHVVLGIQLLYFTSTIFALSIAAVLWRNRTELGAQSLMIGTVGAFVWSAGLLGSTLPPETLAIASIKLMYFGVGVAIAGTLLFALEYSGRERYVTRKTAVLLALHPLLVTLIAVLNPGDFFFTGLDPGVAVGTEQLWGPGFWIHSAYGYTLIIASIGMILGLVKRAEQYMYRGQAASLMIAVAFPLVFNSLFLFEIVTFDVTPIGFIGLVTFLTLSITQFEFTNLTPIARDKVIKNVRDGMLVLDPDGTILDSNPATERIFEMSTSPVGQHVVTDLCAESPTLQREMEAILADESPAQCTVQVEDRHLAIDASPLSNAEGTHSGWTVLIADVTTRLRRQRDLEQQHEKLDQFATLVSEDLREPVDVGRSNVHKCLETGDMAYLDTAEQSLDRMEAIIDDMLTLTREGHDMTEPEPVSVGSVAQSAWDNVETDNASLNISSHAANTTVFADRSAFTQFFEVLYGNSIEHGLPPASEGSADAQPKLDVRVDVPNHMANAVTLVIADTGTGIPSDVRDDVLEDGVSTSGGTGLGLTIVKQIVEAHDWDLTIAASDSGGAQIEITGIASPAQSSKATAAN